MIWKTWNYHYNLITTFVFLLEFVNLYHKCISKLDKAINRHFEKSHMFTQVYLIGTMFSRRIHYLYPITPHSGACTYIQNSTFLEWSGGVCNKLFGSKYMHQYKNIVIKIWDLTKDALLNETTLKQFLPFFKRL